MASPDTRQQRPSISEAGRLARADRREALLDAAAALVAGGEVHAVSMESVADRAGVSRSLVYKYFVNRADLLAALYHREASLLHEQIAAKVRAAESLAGMYRELMHASIGAARERHAVFAALHAAGAFTHGEQDEQRKRDQHTVRVFTDRAIAEFGLPEPAARSATTLLLAAVNTAVAQWLRDPTAEHAVELENAYLSLVQGGFAHLAAGLMVAKGPTKTRRRPRARRSQVV
jgi:AcrR family transcriptional regulator